MVRPSALERDAVGRHHRVDDLVDRAIGADPDERAVGIRAATPHVPAESADIRSAVGRDDHVVQREARQLAQVGVHRGVAPVEHVDDPSQHADHQHAAVGQPSEAGRVLVIGELVDHTPRTVGADLEHLVTPDVHHPQGVIAPTRALRHVDAVEDEADVHDERPGVSTTSHTIPVRWPSRSSSAGLRLSMWPIRTL